MRLRGPGRSERRRARCCRCRGRVRGREGSASRGCRWHRRRRCGHRWKRASPPQPTLRPPVLHSVGHVGGRATASWTLQPGTEARFIEVATSPTTDSTGYFPLANVKENDILQSNQTSWRGDNALAGGTYYVHLSAYDPSCFSCPIRQWSEIKSFTVSNTTTPPPPPGPPPPGPPPPGPPPPGPGCDPSYPTRCIPPPPPDLDCGDISHRNFAVRSPDPHGFDGDNDGVGCET